MFKVETSENHHLGMGESVDLDRLLAFAGFVESRWLPSIAAVIIFGGISLFLWFMSTLMGAPGI